MSRETPADATAMSIGALAHQTGVKVPTIRYYEKVGLLPSPERTPSSRRAYGADAVKRLRFIRRARELGFQIDGIRELLALADEPNRVCVEVDAIALLTSMQSTHDFAGSARFDPRFSAWWTTALTGVSPSAA